MDLVFQAKRVSETTIRNNSDENEIFYRESRSGYFIMDPADEELLFAKIRPEVTIFFLWNMTENRDVWSIVFFPRAIKGSSAVLKARGNLRDKLVFAAYGTVTPGMIDPPLGAFAIQSKKSLHQGAERHPLFAKAWETIKDRSEDKNWVVLIDTNKFQY